MAIIAQSGILGFGPQASKGVDVPTSSWYRHKATLVDLGIIDDQRLGPPEVGGRPLPTLPYKAGVLVGGGATINPRLEGSIGWLLGAALGGNPTTTAGSSSIASHVFRISDLTPGCVKWMGFRKYIPTGCDEGDYGLGETYKDCKITNLVFTFPNDGLIGARVDAMGRSFSLEQDPIWGISSGSTGNWAPIAGEFEDYDSVPIGCQTAGYISTPTFGILPVVQAQIGIQNMPLDVRQERVYGSPYLEDVTIVSRAVTLDITVKWRNPSLYRQILTGSQSGTSWSAIPFTTPITLHTQSPGNMGVTSTPYSLHIEVTSAMLALNGPVTLAGNQALLMRFTGTALDIAGSDYVTFTLVNQVAGYTWPT